MANFKFPVVCLFVLMMGFIPVSLSAQFVTLARKIKSMKSDGKNVATVILDAAPAAVYKAMVDTLSANPKMKISKKDGVKRMVEFSNGDATISMQVDSLEAKLAQVTVLAVSSGTSAQKQPDAAVSAIIGVSTKLGIKSTFR